MTRQYVMTRSSYGPEWTLAQNRSRLAITRAVTARLLARQRDAADWTWIVLMDGRDPLITERMAVFADAAPRFEPIIWTPGEDAEGAPWDKHRDGATRSQRVAATAYKHPAWLQLTPRDEPALQTRLDDDDGLAVDYLARVRDASRRLTARTALMLPVGYRVWDGRQTSVRHDTNAMHTLFTPAGDETTVYSYGHRLVGRGQPVVTVDERPAWLWVRHENTISGWRRADYPITRAVKRLFPIDWRALS